MFAFQYDQQNKTMTIMASGILDKSAHLTLSHCYLKKALEPNIFILDCKAVSYIDSSSIGAFLSFCQYADQCFAKIHITNMSDTILEAFRLLNLHKIFQPMYNETAFRVEWVYHPKY